ncbi:MAG TPA: hypothetical protein VKB72_10340 [Steroidobacteraceae bacterium]|nr:hypothetical protein [Steroidobacteraceae bacterium]
MKTRRVVPSLFAIALSFVLGSAAFAQSLDPRNPAPLQPGTNSGNLDSSVGEAHYYYYWGGPGEVTVTITHVSGGAEAALEIYDEGKSQGIARATVTPQNSSRHLSANLKKESKWIVVVKFPDTGGVRLLRATAGYELAATGAVRFDKAPTGPGLIVGTYISQVMYDNNENSAVKFKPDGTLEFASGVVGTWKLFDENSMIYTVTFQNNRLSLKLVPGTGLVNPGNGSVVFKATK